MISLQFSEDPRSRLRLLRILPRSRALAWDFLAIYSGSAISAIWSRALAGDLLALYSRLALLRWTSPQSTRAPRSRHSGTQ
eukprot:2070662-Pyramimonas_sp.AAC.1